MVPLLSSKKNEHIKRDCPFNCKIFLENTSMFSSCFNFSVFFFHFLIWNKTVIYWRNHGPLRQSSFAWLSQARGDLLKVRLHKIRGPDLVGTLQAQIGALVDEGGWLATHGYNGSCASLVMTLYICWHATAGAHIIRCTGVIGCKKKKLGHHNWVAGIRYIL